MGDKGVAEERTRSLVVYLPTQGKLKQSHNYRTISLISHPSKIILRDFLNRLEARAEELLAEEQTGFRPGRSSVEQIFNSRVITEKLLQHQHDLFHNVLDL